MRFPDGSLTPAPLQTPGVPHVRYLETRLLELRLRGRDVGDAECDRRGRERRELVVVRVRRHDGERDVPGLVLDPVVGRGVRVPPQTEQLSVEVVRRVDVGHRNADVVDALDADHAAASGYGAYRLCSVSGFPSGSVKFAMWQTPVSNVSPWNCTPFASSSARAAARRRRGAGRCCSPAARTRRRTAPAARSRSTYLPPRTRSARSRRAEARESRRRTPATARDPSTGCRRRRPC